jgi:hypothetical protein
VDTEDVTVLGNKLDVVGRALIPALSLRQEDNESEASLDHIARA